MAAGEPARVWSESKTGCAIIGLILLAIFLYIFFSVPSPNGIKSSASMNKYGSLRVVCSSYETVTLARFDASSRLFHMGKVEINWDSSGHYVSKYGNWTRLRTFTQQNPPDQSYSIHEEGGPEMRCKVLTASGLDEPIVKAAQLGKLFVLLDKAEGSYEPVQVEYEP